MGAWTLREMGSLWAEGGRGGLAHPVAKKISSGGGETPMGEQGGQQDGSDATSRTHHARST